MAEEQHPRIQPFGGLERDDFDEVMSALRMWAETHPQRDDPIFFEMGRSYTPVQYVAAVADRADIGMSLFEFIAVHSRETGTRPRAFIDRAIVANAR